MDNLLQTQSDPETAIEASEPVSQPDAPIATAPVAAKKLAASAPALEILGKLAEASKAQRLSAADEERATALLKELLVGGRAGITSALAPLVGLPWIVGVNAVGAVWAGLTAPMRRHLLTSLAKDQGEQARRLRLSLARSIFKLEPAAGLKLAAATAAELKDPETGVLPPKNRQIFFNVFIGKGKPWLLQLPLGELKGAEADSLVHCAVESFPLCPPLSQLSVLRWAHEAGRFQKLSAGDVETACKAIARWNGKLQRQLKTDIPELPEAIVAVLKPEALSDAPIPAEGSNRANQRPAGPQSARSASERGEGGSKQRSGEPARMPREAAVPEAKPASEPQAPLEELTIPSRTARLSNAEPKPPRDRPKQENETQEPRPREDRSSDRRDERLTVRDARDDKGRKPFDFKESLRGLEGYVAGLRAELEQAKAQLRRREEDFKRGARPVRGAERTVETPSADTEALVQHNAQLETTVQELRQQLEDLATHHEAVAESRLLHTDAPLPEGSTEQLKGLLAIKLDEKYATYEAMRSEPLDKVFRLDYRDLLGSVFEVLLNEGVKLKAH